jgi:glutathione S-transferase
VEKLLRGARILGRARFVSLDMNAHLDPSAAGRSPQLTLLFHPLSSFCQKVLVGLYELDVPFAKRLVDLGNETERAALQKLWPMGKFPVLHDEAGGHTLPESSIILEYVDGRFARRTRLVPADPDAARECRLWDRFFDLYVNVPMGKVVTDKLRPEGRHDPHGVDHALAQLETAYALADDRMRTLGKNAWAAGEAFSMADCAAAPALFFADKIAPFCDRRPCLATYFRRLTERPSVARVLEEMQPYWSMFPGR